MPARLLSVVGFALIALGSAAQVSADIALRRRQQRRPGHEAPPVLAGAVHWPRSGHGPRPFVIQVANGWRRQNMLGEFHFEPGTGQLTEAGRLKVRWILTAGPQQHRLIYVHTAEKNEETSARIAAVQQLAAQITPNDVPPVMPTSISDDGWPADQVDLIGRKYPVLDSPPTVASPDGCAAAAAVAAAGISGRRSANSPSSWTT